MSPPARRWGVDRAPLDDDEARSRLLDAAARCIVRRGDAQIRMAEVADEAGVVRSTVYRYYASRDELLLGLMLQRIDAALHRWVQSLKHSGDAAGSLRSLVLEPVAAVDDGDPLNRALYAGASAAVTSVLAVGAEAITDVVVARLEPLFDQWRDDGQIYADLSVRETAQWLSATSSFLLTPVWRQRPEAAKRRFVDRYLLRALVC